MLGIGFVPAFGLGQIVEQAADIHIPGPGGGPGVELLGFHLHGRGETAHGVESEGPHQPDGLALHEALDVLAANQRDMVAELAFEQVGQALAMGRFLGAHAFQDLGRGRERFPQAVGEIGIDPLVFLFQGDGEGQDFRLAEFRKSFHNCRVCWFMASTAFRDNPARRSKGLSALSA